jgi:hypothetical protein
MCEPFLSVFLVKWKPPDLCGEQVGTAAPTSNQAAGSAKVKKPRLARRATFSGVFKSPQVSHFQCAIYYLVRAPTLGLHLYLRATRVT